MITCDQFKEIDLRIAKIITAERVESSDRLLCLRISLGQEERQIIAGIGTRYRPEQLLGMEIVIVANLEPRKLMGLESQGMLLAADSPAGPVLLVPGQEVPPGVEIK
ncbi:MAG: methionine--tRNA ligase subunit beta [Candidatus Sungbacteria bacterium]|nr:methionine--tRNA ligase subunit beta [Candidatus Sungbacteria bacterium]